MLDRTDLAEPRIVRGGVGDRRAVLAILTAAFAADPAARALYPDRADHDRYFPGFAEAFAWAAFAKGSTDLTGDGSGAALWLPPGVEPDEERIMAHLEATIDDAIKPAIMAGMMAQAGLHPHAPHWYLPFIGVRPEAQGAGIGAALLRHGLARADAERLPVYLEATSRRSVRLYARHGFEVTGVVESPAYPEIFAMWRPARG